MFVFIIHNYKEILFDENKLTFDNGMFGWICHAPDDDGRVKTTARNHVGGERPSDGIYSRVVEAPFSVVRKLQKSNQFKKYLNFFLFIFLFFITEYKIFIPH